jgi:hypothetical protein
MKRFQFLIEHGYALLFAWVLLEQELEKRNQEIPRDRDIVLYCS